MAHTIKLKRSETASSAPTGSDLSTHEIAMNVTDLLPLLVLTHPLTVIFWSACLV